MSADTFYFMRKRRHGSRISIEDVKLVHCFLSWIPVVMINSRKNILDKEPFTYITDNNFKFKRSVLGQSDRTKRKT